MRRISSKRKAKRKPRAKVRHKASRKAAAHDFAAAVLANLNERYWELASPVLDGEIAVDQYSHHVGRLLALKEAGSVVKATMQEQDTDDDDDQEVGNHGED